MTFRETILFWNRKRLSVGFVCLQVEQKNGEILHSFASCKESVLSRLRQCIQLHGTQKQDRLRCCVKAVGEIPKAFPKELTNLRESTEQNLSTLLSQQKELVEQISQLEDELMMVSSHSSGLYERDTLATFQLKEPDRCTNVCGWCQRS